MLVLGPATDARARLLVELLADPVVPADALVGIGFNPRWFEPLSAAALDGLLLALMERPEPVVARESVGLT